MRMTKQTVFSLYKSAELQLRVGQPRMALERLNAARAAAFAAGLGAVEIITLDRVRASLAGLIAVERVTMD